MGFFWPEAEVNQRLEAKMCEAFEDVLKTSVKYKTDLRTGRLHRRHQPRRDGDQDARDVRVEFLRTPTLTTGARRRQCASASIGPSGRSVARRPERVPEHVIRHIPPLAEPLRLVKCPVNPEIDAAFCVLLLSF